MLNLNMSSRLDTISLLKLEMAVHCQLEFDTTLKKVFMLNLNMSNRLDTISLLKLEMIVHCQFKFDTTLGIDESECSKIYLHVLQH